MAEKKPTNADPHPEIIEGRCSAKPAVRRGSTGAPLTDRGLNEEPSVDETLTDRALIKSATTETPSNKTPAKKTPAKKTSPQKTPPNPLIPSYRPRHDGWTLARTKTFLATLRQTGCVRDACRVIGMSNNSAYRLRQRDPDFARHWQEALVDARRGLVAVAHERAVVGRETVIIRQGQEVERRIQPSDSMLALLIKQGKLSGENGGQQHPDKIITWAEWQERVRFNDHGVKYTEADPDYYRERLDKKFAQMNRAYYRSGHRHLNIKTGKGVTDELIAAVLKFHALRQAGAPENEALY